MHRSQDDEVASVEEQGTVSQECRTDEQNGTSGSPVPGMNNKSLAPMPSE